MSNIIDFNAAAVSKKILTEPKKEYTDRRTLNLIRKEIYEVVGAALPTIDKKYNFITFLKEGQVFDFDSIEEGGYLSEEDIKKCYELSFLLAPLVDKMAEILKETINYHLK